MQLNSGSRFSSKNTSPSEQKAQAPANSFLLQKNTFQFKTAAIIGGGIAGYTMAACLSRNGINVDIYERNNGTSGSGLGFLLLKNGIDCLNTLGLKSKLLLKGNSINFFRAINPNGELIYSQTLSDCLAISRSNIMELLSELFDKDKLHYSSAFKCMNIKSDGSIDSIEFQNGKSIQSDIYFGSDGIRSSIRKQIFPETELTPVGENELVAIVELPNMKFNNSEFIKVIDNEQGCNLGLIPLTDNQYIWFFQLNPKILVMPDKNAKAIENFMKECVKKYPKEFQEAINQTNFEHVFSWHSQRLDLLPKFHHNNLALIGDAAHPLIAFTSQGANSAIEDAVTLSSLLSHQRSNESLEQIFENFYSIRKDLLTKYIQEGDELVEHFLMMSTNQAFKIPLAVH